MVITGRSGKTRVGNLETGGRIGVNGNNPPLGGMIAGHGALRGSRESRALTQTHPATGLV